MTYDLRLEIVEDQKRIDYWIVGGMGGREAGCCVFHLNVYIILSILVIILILYW